MARWRMWDVTCVEETSILMPEDDETDTMLIPEGARDIPCIDLNKIVLPKAALIGTASGGTSSGRLRGRGRLLTNRALGLVKPTRRPGEREIDSTTEGSKSSKASLGSQFFGLKILCDEFFPPLDQASLKKDSLKSSKPAKSIWNRPTEVRLPTDVKQSCSQKETINVEEDFSKTSEEKQTGNIVDSPEKSTSNGNVLSDVPEIGIDNDNNADFNNASKKDNALHKEDILNEDNKQIINSCQSNNSQLEKQQGKCFTPDKANIYDELSASQCDKTPVCDNEDIQTSEFIDTEILENHNSIESTKDEEQSTARNPLPPKQETNADLNNVNEDGSDIVSSKSHSLSFDFDNCKESEQHSETASTDTGEKSHDSSCELSGSFEEMEPCNVFLENLPLALTEEELQEIVEPYGETLSYFFKDEDNTSKTCVLRMANSMIGELLVISLDGLEVNGHRIKAIVPESM